MSWAQIVKFTFGDQPILAPTVHRVAETSGTVTNTAARLCAEALDGQILVTRRVITSLQGAVPHQPMGALALKGLSRPIEVFEITG